MPQPRKLLVLAGLSVVGLAATGVGTAASAAGQGGRLRVLSTERTLSRWAYPVVRGKVHAEPTTLSPTIAHLRFLTENGSHELYLALEQRVDAVGIPWARVRLPGRPNGRTGWVARNALGAFHIVRTYLLVNRQTLRATLYRSGKRVLQAPIGVGKASTPTPAGRFWIRDKFAVRNAPFYGPRAIGTSAYARKSEWPGGDVVGIHGTSRPELVPGRPSHGCIRLRNSDIARLYKLAPRGTPIEIR